MQIVALAIADTCVGLCRYLRFFRLAEEVVFPNNKFLNKLASLTILLGIFKQISSFK